MTLTDIREAQRAAERALLQLESAYRMQSEGYPVGSRHRAVAIARADAVRGAAEAIHYHQAERITLHRVNPHEVNLS